MTEFSGDILRGPSRESQEGVAALDGDAFVVDSHNSRIVQVRLTGAVSREVPLP
jgi:hypothetical protein